MKRGFVGFLTLLSALFAVSASAIVPPKDDTSRPEWFQAPKLGANPSLDRMERGNPRATDHPGVAKFFAANTDAWNVTWDTRSNRAHLIQGPGVDRVASKASFRKLDDVADQTRAFMSENPDLFNVDQANLVFDKANSGTFGDRGQLTFVTFQQMHDGIPVEDATVFFRFNSGKLRSFGTVRVADIHLNTRANLDRDGALQRVLDHAGFLADDVTELLNDGELKIVPTLPPGESAGHTHFGAPGLGYRHALVREVSFRIAGDAATYEALIDAKNGQILKLVDGNAYVRGGVMIYGPNIAAPSVKSSEIKVFPPNTTTTAGPCTALNGANIRIIDNCGSIYVCDSNDADGNNGEVHMGQSPSNDCSTPGFGGDGNTRSSRSTFYHLATIRDEAYAYHPTNSWLRSKVTSRVNINESCNSYWNGSSVNFYLSGNDCSNTGEIAAFALHEWGHGFDTNTGGTANEAASGEAVGDIFAALYTGEECIGDGFLSTTCHNCTNCTGVRDVGDFGLNGSAVRATPANIENDSGIDCDRWSCPYTSDMGPMGYESHCEAIIASSAVWNLAEDIGFPATWNLWYASLIPSKSAFQVQSGGQCNTSAMVDGCGANNWYSVFQDADDGTYECEIWDAFDAQGIACGSRPSC